MSIRQEILYLIRYELKRSWPALIGTFLFTSIFGIATIILFNSNINSGFSLDFIFITVLPYFCTLYGAKEYWSISKLKQDPFTQQLAWYRTLPISLHGFTMSRMVLSLVLVLVMSTSFFLSIYPFSKPIHSMDAGHYLSFALMWTAYAFSVGSAYTYLEWCKRGIWIFWGPIIVMTVIVCPIIFWLNVFRVNVVQWTIHLSITHPILSVLIAWMSAACLIIGWFFVIKKQIHTRDLAID
ncbi:hypothetical protein [Marininema halotolerans]|uniref:ABC-2 type transport system permease protein n=1 Tax=Marininema halotolerans TaxID=1155944 RepID=A0A1I6PBT9_9BACL|nr:hypothetical protein [Marininema halotolerans]SFS37629.1 hypothetical protein SAMN05444972_101488 [Marininema halotolerans]